MEQLARLCKRINQAVLDASPKGLKQQDLCACGVGRLKKETAVLNGLGQSLPAGSYFVLWAGQEQPQALWLLENMQDDPEPGCFNSFFLGYVQDYGKILDALGSGRPNETRDVEWLQGFRVGHSGLIDLELIKQLRDPKEQMIQETGSLLLCMYKKDLAKLCRLLNKAALGSEDGPERIGFKTLGVGRLKQPVCLTMNPQLEQAILMGWPANSYFVWWDGKVKSQDYRWIQDYMEKHFGPGYCDYWPANMESISSEGEDKLCGWEMFMGMMDGMPGEIQENEWVQAISPNEDGRIDIKLVDRLKHSGRVGATSCVC